MSDPDCCNNPNLLADIVTEGGVSTMEKPRKRPGTADVVAREYLRVSKDRYSTGKSPDQQHDDNAKAVQNQGWQLHPKAYRDDDRSASRYAKRDREDFDRLISDLKAGRFEATILVLWESSRGSRRVGEWLTLIELCEERAIRIFVTTHGRDYDPGNPRDRRSLLEDAVDSEYESAKTSTRVKRDVRAAAEKGRPHGKNLYGYRRVYHETTRELLRVEPDPDQAKVVKEAAERVLAGETLYSIAKLFNERGIPPRRASYKAQRQHLGWTPPAVRQMLTTPAYAGKRQYHGEIVSDAVWPALLDADTWENRLMPLLNARGGKKANDWPARHLLTGIAVCGVCGGGVIPGKQNKGSQTFDDDGNPLPRRHYAIYVCKGAPGLSGSHVAMKEEHLDLVVVEMVLERVKRPDFLARVGRQGEGVDAERQALLDEIEEHREYLEAVRKQAAARKRLDLLFDQEDRIRPLIVAAQKRLEHLTATDPLVLDLAKAEDVRAAWERLELASKRRIIRALMTPRIGPMREGWKGRRAIDYDRVQPGWQ
ncbi:MULTISPECIES: recombinase family protein [Arthrobacter]|uniref:recombinase family protein n=1 Tax=Arthrobacter TaxID=1663 RepID=UPI001404FCDA|nr:MULTISPECIES: recombinase family protein [Arthrobacter]MBT8162619.1 recombinase family protein [Arthrobacter sp. GN70]